MSCYSRSALASALIVFCGVAAEAQSVVLRRTGPFASVDVVGSPFVIELEGRDVGGAVGYRLGGGAEVAVRLDHASPQEFVIFDIPGKTLVGFEGGIALGPERSPWHLAAGVGAAWEGRSEIVYFEEGVFEFRGGLRLNEMHATASAGRSLRIVEGTIGFSLGAGVYAERRYFTPETKVYNAGSPDEIVDESEGVTDDSYGVVFTSPVAVRLGAQAVVSVRPALRLDPAVLGLGGGALAHVAVRLDL